MQRDTYIIFNSVWRLQEGTCTENSGDSATPPHSVASHNGKQMLSTQSFAIT